jgi:hypothetical protein
MKKLESKKCCSNSELNESLDQEMDAFGTIDETNCEFKPANINYDLICFPADTKKEQTSS